MKIIILKEKEDDKELLYQISEVLNRTMSINKKDIKILNKGDVLINNNERWEYVN